MLSTMERASTLVRRLPELIRIAGTVAEHCDRAEHVEQISRDSLVATASRCRALAVDLATELRVDLRELYAERLGSREGKHVLADSGAFDGAAAVRCAQTWRHWQQAQWNHDVTYLPDVAGMSRHDQISHYGHHLTKLVDRMQRGTESEEDATVFVRDRLPDIVLFGIKLSTVVNDCLPQEPLPF